MGKIFRCPMCNRNVRLSNNARKIVRHRQWEQYEEVLYEFGMGTHVTASRIRLGPVCPASNLKEGDARKFKRTMEAFRCP